MPLPSCTSQSTIMARVILSSLCIRLIATAVMNHTEAFSVIRERVMKSAANVACHPVAQGPVGGKNRSSRCQPERLHQLRGIRHFRLLLFQRGERSRLDLLHVLARMHQQNVFVLRRFAVMRSPGAANLLSSSRLWIERYSPPEKPPRQSADGSRRYR